MEYHYLKPDSSGRVSLKKVYKKDLPSYMHVYFDGDKIILKPASEEEMNKECNSENL